MPTTRTVTVKPSGGDYTSLAAAEAGEQADLVSLDRILVIECYSMQDTTAVTFDGWTTDATRYILVTVPAAERHDGKWNTSKYRLVASATLAGVINNAEDYFIVDGVQVHNTSTNAGSGIVASNVSFTATNNMTTVQNCIVRGAGSQSNALERTAGVGHYNISGHDRNNFRVRNTMIYDFTDATNPASGVSGGAAFSGTMRAHNVTVQNCKTGCKQGSTTTFTAKNVLAQSCGDGFNGTIGGNNNCSDISSDAPGTSAQTGSVTFVDAANDDFHLASGDTVAKGNGADLSADATWPFSDDIDGQTRVAPWDIGADEFVSLTAWQSKISRGSRLLQGKL